MRNMIVYQAPTEDNYRILSKEHDLSFANPATRGMAEAARKAIAKMRRAGVKEVRPEVEPASQSRFLYGSMGF
jgi:hypothetical protein